MPRARTILDGTDIAVPAAFTGPALADLKRTAASDAGSPRPRAARMEKSPSAWQAYTNCSPAAAMACLRERALIHAAATRRQLTKLEFPLRHI